MERAELQAFRRSRARTWIFRKSWSRHLLEMDDRTAGQVIKMICRYERGQVVDPEDIKDRTAALAAAIILDDLDDMDRAFADKIARDPVTRQHVDNDNGAA